MIRFLKQVGYEGPYAGKKHQFMVRGSNTVFLPNPHGEEIGVALVSRMLHQAEIDKDEWEKL